MGKENKEIREKLREEREGRGKEILRGLKGERRIKGEMEAVMKKLGVKVGIEEVRKIEAGRRDKGCMLIVKVGSEEKRKMIK